MTHWDWLLHNPEGQFLERKSCYDRSDGQAEAHLRRSGDLFDELGLETDGAQTVRAMLRMGLEEGWEAMRQALNH